MSTNIGNVTKVNLPTSPSAGDVTRVSDDVRGIWLAAPDAGGTNRWNPISTSVNVKEFGALANGGDDHDAISAAIGACSAAGGGQVYFPRGTYGCASQLVLPSGVSLAGAGRDVSILDFTLYGNTPAACILAQGTVGASIALNDDVARGATTIHAAAHGLVSGDRFLLGSNEGFKGSSSTAPIYQKGELCIAYAVPDADHIALLAPTFDAYTASVGGTVQKVAMVTNVGVDALTIHRQPNNATDAFLLQFHYCERVRVERSKFDNATYAAVWFDTCLDFSATGNSVVDTYRSDGTNNGLSYCFAIDNASQFGRIENNYCLRFRHAVKLGKNASPGIPRMVDVVGNNFDKTARADNIAGAVDCHFYGQFINYTGNVVATPVGTSAFVIGGYDCNISENICIGGGIRVGTHIDLEWIQYNTVDTYARSKITGNKISAIPGMNTQGILIEADGCIASGNVIDMTGSTPAGGGIVVQSSYNRKIADTLISGNDITSPVASAIDVRGVSRCRIDNNVLRPGAAYGVYVGDNFGGGYGPQGCQTVDIDNNTITNDTMNVAIGIYFNTAIGHTDCGYRGNTINLNGAGGNPPVKFDGSVSLGARQQSATVFDQKITLAIGGPTISTGTTVPNAPEPDGSLYVRSGSPNGSLYVRANGVWVLK